MKKKLLLILTFIPLIIAVSIILIYPKEILIQETMRFYNCESVMYEGYPDDTEFSVFTDKYLDVKADIKVNEGIASYYIEGALEIEGVKFYVSSASSNSDSPGKFAIVMQEGKRIDSSNLRMSNDLKHIELVIAQGEMQGIWTNAATLGDYKKEVKSLYSFEL